MDATATSPTAKTNRRIAGAGLAGAASGLLSGTPVSDFDTPLSAHLSSKAIVSVAAADLGRDAVGLEQVIALLEVLPEVQPRLRFQLRHGGIAEHEWQR